MVTKGIILAGGKGTRLRPVSDYISKHLLPVYNKPMIYYSISVLIYAGIKNILIICNEGDDLVYRKLTQPISEKYRVNFNFKIQRNPVGGIAESFLIGSEFIKNTDKVALMLGDNFFYGREFPALLKKTLKDKKSYIFLCPVKNPKEFGIVYLNKKNKIIKIIEKPKNNFSNLAVTGLYIYNSKELKNVKKLKRSKRGELEITSLNNILIKNKKLNYINLGRGITWFDMGTFDKLYECSEFIKLIENKQGFEISKLI
ncbi:sugar phosphate nucleotidyltransferase [Candidatus Pelagibacter sp. HIMB1509]|uniref:sugar phosphate nucleotidyltransferase n=1 Tax=Candidatus Pelagibacter sp. HIMB1509 TaxID=3413339 RepID=UPI003F8450C8